MELIKTPKVENVQLLNSASKKKIAKGTLYLTAANLAFVDPERKKEKWILYSHISSVEKLPLTAAGSPLKIRCKTFLTATFVISRERDCHDVYSALLHLSNPEKLEDLYAFSYKPKDETLNQTAGWALFDMRSEYARMGLPSDNWFLNNINKDYQQAKIAIVDRILKELHKNLHKKKDFDCVKPIPACFFYQRMRHELLWLAVQGSEAEEGCQPCPTTTRRQKRYCGRLSYFNAQESSRAFTKEKTAICRCSQPLSGINNTRSTEDEQMVQAILKATPNSKYLYIVDTRPKLNAMANRAAGKGYENTDFYENVKFQFVGIENIHVMRQSLQKLVEVTSDVTNLTASQLLSGMESSSWLKHIKAILDTSAFIAKALVEEEVSVLVHCSDGWDRTAQTCSLASIMLDPYYRTIHGFQVLIEKEWLSFGHKFTHRCGFLQVDPKEVSPVFTQFLECVWQLQEQFPFAFQFNERFLLTMHNHLFSCQFGTFLGDCEKERKDHRLSEKTYSLWGYMWQNISEYANPLFQEEKDELLWPDTCPQALKYWRSMYNRYDNGFHPRERVLDSLCSIIDHNDSLRDHIRLLTSRILMLQRLSSERQLSSTANESQGDRQKEVPTLNHVISTKAIPTEDSACVSSDKGERLLFCNYNQSDSDVTTQMNELCLKNNGNCVGESESLGSDSADSEVRKDISEELQLSLRRQRLTIDDLLNELPDFAVKWKSIRDVSQCSACVSPIDYLSRKYHCWNCGEVFCKRCTSKQCSLPGHYSENLVPVCRTCLIQVKKTK